MEQLTPTSYAILGLLAIRPWSAYELTAQMKRSTIRLVWPRAESNLYEAPKKLVANGLAAARRERTGGRRRSVYHITPKGRRALRAWLDEPGAGLLVEFETMIKVVYGDFGTKRQLLRNIHRIRDSMIHRSSLALALVVELAEKGPRYPQRAHINALTDRFIIDVMQTTLRWALWAEQIVRSWSSIKMNDQLRTQARELLAENAAAIEAMASLHPVDSHGRAGDRDPLDRETRRSNRK